MSKELPCFWKEWGDGGEEVQRENEMREKGGWIEEEEEQNEGKNTLSCFSSIQSVRITAWTSHAHTAKHCLWHGKKNPTREVKWLCFKLLLNGSYVYSAHGIFSANVSFK